ncbi:hypothetical protein FRC02_001815 [Tulasnella sp. 418]|nr:hypothetical protein FRC02_001815 [Tulasnella sp. 418]
MSIEVFSKKRRTAYYLASSSCPDLKKSASQASYSFKESAKTAQNHNKQDRGDQKYRKYAKPIAKRDFLTRPAPLRLKNLPVNVAEDMPNSNLPKTPSSEKSSTSEVPSAYTARLSNFRSHTISSVLKMKPSVHILRSPANSVASPALRHDISRTASETNIIGQLPSVKSGKEFFSKELILRSDVVANASLTATSTPALTDDAGSPSFLPVLSTPSAPTSKAVGETLDSCNPSIGLGLFVHDYPAAATESTVGSLIRGDDPRDRDKRTEGEVDDGAQVYEGIARLIGENKENLSLFNHYIGCYDEGLISQVVLLKRARQLIMDTSDANGSVEEREEVYKGFEAVVLASAEENTGTA